VLARGQDVGEALDKARQGAAAVTVSL